MFETRSYRVMESVTNLLLLNAAWVITSLPLVTMFPATAALFGAIRDRRRGSEASALASFLHNLRDNFRQSLLIGVLWWVTGAVLLVDYRLLGDMPSAAQFLLFMIFSVGMTAFVLTSVYLFPVMVSYRNDWKSVVHNAFLVSVSQLHTSVACLLVIGAAGVLATQFPLTLLFTASATAHAVYALCAHGLRRVEGVQNTST